MNSNKELRAMALQRLSGNWANAVLASFIYILLAVGNATIQNLNNLKYLPGETLLYSLGTLIFSLIILYPLRYGIETAFLQFYRTEESDITTKMFQAFKNIGRAIGVILLQTIFIFFWTILLIIPGIIKSYAYAMTIYIAYDHPEWGADECIRESMKMMQGYKWKLFLLDLSFIGWFLLCLLTFGLGFFLLLPYIQTSHAAFYEELKCSHLESTENQEENIITETAEI